MSFMAHEAAHLDAPALDAARERSRLALFAGVALGSTGNIAAATVAAIVGQQLLGTPALAGAPGAAVVFGAAMGAIALSWVMARRGRRVVHVAGLAGSSVIPDTLVRRRNRRPGHRVRINHFYR